MTLSIFSSLDEAAKTVKDAVNLALYVDHDGGNVRCILYYPDLMEDLFRGYFKKFYGSNITIDSLKHSGFTNPVVGMMRLNKHNDYQIWIVENSAAEKGYGPLMYDIAFAFAGSKGLAPDRASIRPAAKNIWQYIYTQRQKEFDILPLIDKYNYPATRYSNEKNQDESYLDKRYVMKNPNVKLYQSLFQANRVCMGILNHIPTEFIQDVDKFISLTARWFFQEKYEIKESSLKLFIERIIREELEEVAVSHDEISSKGLALNIALDHEMATITLYDPTLYKQEKLMIVAMIELQQDQKCKAWKIVTSSAEKGYGPFIYDIAFSYAGEMGIMSDRARVSDAARKIWNYNLTKRRNDFNILPIPQLCQFKGPRPEQALNMKFVLKNPINYKNLVDRGNAFISTFKGHDQKEFFDEFMDQQDAFFQKKYFA